jgi:hypothetical protein
VSFKENISYFFERRYRKLSGNLCFSCTTKTFATFELRTLFGTWWGLIGCVVGPYYIFHNLVEYAEAAFHFALKTPEKNYPSVEKLKPLDNQPKNDPLIAKRSVEETANVLAGHSEENEWYVFVNGKELGPAKFDGLAELANRGVLQKNIQVRRSGTDQWIAAGDIPDLFPIDTISETKSAASKISISKADRLRLEPPNTDAPTDRAPATRTDAKPRKWKNYIVRHWRGELSLPISYWINGFLGNIAAVVAIAAITTSADIKDNFRPEIALLSIILIWATVLVVFVWQMVGVWRSATNYQQTKLKSSWGGIAKFFMVIALLRTIGSFIQTGAPQIIEYYKIYAGDEEVGKYAFRVLRDGKELEFSGGITFGAAKEFKRFIDAMGAIKLIHLNSLGGRIEEAQRIGDIIMRRGLSTYVSNRCLSACTIIFLSGRERLISSESKIGFHQPNFPGMTDEVRRQMIASEERRLQELGVSAAFAHKANLASPDNMWFPTSSELLSERVATKLVNSSDLAMSGIDPADFTKERLNETLSRIDIYESIRKTAPQTYAIILERFQSGVQRGQSIAELRSEIAPMVVNVFNNSLPYTSDANLLLFAKFAIKIASVYNKDDPSACYFYLNPKKAKSNILVKMGDKYEELTVEEQQLESQIIKSYSGKTISIPSEQDVSASLKSVISSLMNRKIDLNLFNDDNITPDKYYLYCDGLIALYEETLNLPKKDAAALIRYFVASK